MKTKKITAISIFAALIIILQTISTYINFSGFPITLTLIPIIIAGAIYGPLTGAIMGFVFGCIVSIMVINGSDVAGAAMFATHPLITILICLTKGIACGYFSALSYKILKGKNNKQALIVASVVAPITNTFILCLGLIMFFDSSFQIMITTFISINFVIELLINALLSPGLLGLINRYKQRYN